MKLFRHCAGAIAIALALGSTGCSSDEPINKGNGVAEQDETRYILITLSSPDDGSRADIFENGTTNENAVTRLDFLFYDIEGNQIGEPQTFTGSDLKDADFSNQPEHSNVARIWTSVVPVQIEQGKALPAQVMCLVNAEASRATSLKGKSLTQLLDITDGKFYNGQNFVMTNSVFYGTSPYVSGTTRICATPVNAGQLFSSQEEAQKALDNATATGATDVQKALMVDIYVERSAAKVGLTLSSNTVEKYELDNGDSETPSKITLTFVPQYWFMNAIDKTMFSTKRYGIPANGVNNMDPTYAQITENFASSGMAETWNDPQNNRSYWGCSPSYAVNSFPLVSDNVNDLAGNKKAIYNQNYYSFNEVKNFAAVSNAGIQAKAIAWANNSFSITNTGTAATGYIYTTETTTAKTSINDVANGNPAAAVGSAVIVGHYYAGASEPTQNEYPTFWIDVNDGENGTFYSQETNAKKALAERNSFIFSDDKGANAITNTDAFVLIHPNKTVRDILTDEDNIAGRYVTLQLATVPQTAYYWDGTQYAQITSDNLAKANAALAGVGYLDMYNNGRAFFNIPIRHLGWPANDQYTGTDNSIVKLYDNGTYNWDKMRVGDLGIVRNHVYTINVTKIGGLGSGLRSDDQPIVPPVHAYKQYIAMRLNILAWRIVPAQNIEL